MSKAPGYNYKQACDSSIILLVLQLLCVPVAAFSDKPSIRLQVPHPERSPVEALQDLAKDYETLGLSPDEAWDVYGDFDDKSAENSYLRRFEKELATELGMPDAVFMPSGVMAQSIALKIHSKNFTSPSFMCHATSHLLLHEGEAYHEVCGLDAVVLPKEESKPGLGFDAPPLGFQDVESYLREAESTQPDALYSVAALLLELPHRELGGKLTPWEDIVKLRQLTKDRGIAFHCDGARIFEATTGYRKSPSELAAQFDSVYISFYKGLGGLSGAMLLGSHEFCEEARLWLRRMGGNLYTQLPTAIAGWSGYRKYWAPKGNGRGASQLLSFDQKKEKLLRLVKTLSAIENVSKVITFDPRTPQVTMVHGYLKFPSHVIEKARDQVEKEMGLSVIHRWRPIDDPMDDPQAHRLGYRAKFELSMGEANGQVPDDLWIQGWQRFAEAILNEAEAMKSIVE